MESIWNLCSKHKMQKPRVHILMENTWLEQWNIPKGTKIKAFETKNFGFILIPLHTKDVRGFEIPKHIFRY